MLLFLRCTGEGVDETVLAIPEGGKSTGALSLLGPNLRSAAL
jgi:hypothetical protein